jgi:hypothetical protein
MRHLTRGGRYLRVADPDWRNPLSPSYSKRRGGRWNAPGSFSVVYLNDSPALARAQVRAKLEPRGIRPEDLDPDRGPLLIHTDVPRLAYVDAVSERGLRSLGLPASYPLDANGETIPHGTCQPIGQRAREAGEPGIACRSAVGAQGEEELAYFGKERLPLRGREGFAEWFWGN